MNLSYKMLFAFAATVGFSNTASATLVVGVYDAVQSRHNVGGRIALPAVQSRHAVGPYIYNRAVQSRHNAAASTNPLHQAAVQSRHNVGATQNSEKSAQAKNTETQDNSKTLDLNEGF